MAPFLVLVFVFFLLISLRFFILKDRLSLSASGRYAMAIMLLFTGIAHFTNTEDMSRMIPDSLPGHRIFVWITGVCELLAVIGLIWTRFTRLTGFMLIIFFMAVLPANVVGSMREVGIGGMESGTGYLYFRIPLQVFFILWTYYFCIGPKRPNAESGSGS